MVSEIRELCPWQMFRMNRLYSSTQFTYLDQIRDEPDSTTSSIISGAVLPLSPEIGCNEIDKSVKALMNELFFCDGKV